MQQLDQATKDDIARLIEIALKPIEGVVTSFEPEIPMAQVVSHSSSYHDEEGGFFCVRIASNEGEQSLRITIKPDVKLWNVVLDALEQQIFPYQHISSESKEKIKSITAKISESVPYPVEIGPFVKTMPLGEIVSTVRALVDQKEIVIKFGISGPDMSMQKWNLDSVELLGAVHEFLSGDLISGFDFNGIYYATFTGNHFHQNEEIPLWASIEMYQL